MRAAFLTLVLIVAACGTPSASPDRTTQPANSSPSSDASPTGFLFDLNGHADFYTWSGTFVRRATPTGHITASPDGRYYVDTEGRIWTAGGSLSGTIAQWATASFGWSGDGDYLCGSGKDPSGHDLIYVIDAQGHSREYILSSPGAIHNVVACSTRTDRAAVLEESGITVLSLSDGHVERTVHLASQTKPLQAGSWVVSPDVLWLAESAMRSTGTVDTYVTDLGDGAVQARVTDTLVIAFSPDGKSLVVNNQKGTKATTLNWRTGAEQWTIAGHVAMLIAHSDTSTNKVLLWISTGSTAAGTDTHDYWIVDGSGTATLFTPQN